MFDKSQDLYDAIYAWKDYPREAALLRGWIARAGIEDGASLLDVACGTGGHIPFLRYNYDVEGLDLDEGLLAVAHEKNPGVPFHVGDMTDFDLGREFDIVTCLFSAIAYAQTTEGLSKAIGAMAHHLKPGGVLIFDPFIAPDAWKGHTPNARFVDRTNLKLVRMADSERTGNLVTITFHYLVSSPDGVAHFSELHDIALFSDADYRAALAKHGFTAEHDAQGLMGRGLYVARKSVS